MGYIRELSEELVKKIAAGEVIERPASVVKELVENSIDAGATKIEIVLERGGKYIKVSDNGMGISPDDIDLLFKRHATSKIRYFDDLWNLNSLGFRGEALASISAVSKIKCASKHINQEYGFEIRLVDEKINKKSSSISIGTIFEIDDLFYNVPARQKFLKADNTEFSHVYDIVTSLALSHPKLSFTLKQNKDVVLNSSGSNNLSQAVIELVGNDLKDRLISLSEKNDFLEINGYVSALEVFKSNRKSMFLFINNRPIKCQIVSKAINSACEGLLPAGKYPVVVLNLKFKSKFVDVNVHPTKMEVRYTNPNDVYNLVLHCVQDAVSNHYKKEYKEKSVYALSEFSTEAGSWKLEAGSWKPEVPNIDLASSLQPPASYSDAAFKLYENTEIKELTSLFSVRNLECKVISSNKPIASMTKIGNKTIFEVGSIFDDDLQIVFNGEIVGSQDYQKNFFNCLSDLSKEIYKSYLEDKSVIQGKIINQNPDEDNLKEKTRKKPPDSTLYKVWERDNWTCVYCAKQLLDPKIVKTALSQASGAFIDYINEKGEKITKHLLSEHSASYDHYLPVSKLPQFNFDEENLFACCIECNRKKLDSMELNTWKPNRKNNWTKPLVVAGLCFNSPSNIQVSV